MAGTGSLAGCGGRALRIRKSSPSLLGEGDRSHREWWRGLSKYRLLASIPLHHPDYVRMVPLPETSSGRNKLGFSLPLSGQGQHTRHASESWHLLICRTIWPQTSMRVTRLASTFAGVTWWGRSSALTKPPFPTPVQPELVEGHALLSGGAGMGWYSLTGRGSLAGCGEDGMAFLEGESLPETAMLLA